MLVLRLVTAGTVETRIQQLAEGKETLERFVIHRGKFKLQHFDKSLLANGAELIGHDTAPDSRGRQI